MKMEIRDDLFDGSQKQGIRAERSREIIQRVSPVPVGTMWILTLTYGSLRTLTTSYCPDSSSMQTFDIFESQR